MNQSDVFYVRQSRRIITLHSVYESFIIPIHSVHISICLVLCYYSILHSNLCKWHLFSTIKAPHEGQRSCLDLHKGTSTKPLKLQPTSLCGYNLLFGLRTEECTGVCVCVFVCWAPTESPSLCCVGGSLPNQGSLHGVSARVSRERRGDQGPD